jgi:hypothetical protein
MRLFSTISLVTYFFVQNAIAIEIQEVGGNLEPMSPHTNYNQDFDSQTLYEKIGPYSQKKGFGYWNGTAPFCNGECDEQGVEICSASNTDPIIRCDQSDRTLRNLTTESVTFGETCVSGKKKYCIHREVALKFACTADEVAMPVGRAQFIEQSRPVCAPPGALLQFADGFYARAAPEGCHFFYNEEQVTLEKQWLGAPQIMCMFKSLKGLSSDRGACHYDPYDEECRASNASDAVNCWQCDDFYRDKLAMKQDEITHISKVVDRQIIPDGRYIYVWQSGGDFLIRNYDRWNDDSLSDECHELYKQYQLPSNSGLTVKHVRHTQVNGSWDAVKAAGELKVKNGKIVKINNSSGHYKPGVEFVHAAVEHLRDVLHITVEPNAAGDHAQVSTEQTGAECRDLLKDIQSSNSDLSRHFITLDAGLTCTPFSGQVSLMAWVNKPPAYAMPSRACTYQSGVPGGTTLTLDFIQQQAPLKWAFLAILGNQSTNTPYGAEFRFAEAGESVRISSVRCAGGTTSGVGTYTATVILKDGQSCRLSVGAKGETMGFSGATMTLNAVGSFKYYSLTEGHLRGAQFNSATSP